MTSFTLTPRGESHREKQINYKDRDKESDPVCFPPGNSEMWISKALSNSVFCDYKWTFTYSMCTLALLCSVFLSPLSYGLKRDCISISNLTCQYGSASDLHVPSLSLSPPFSVLFIPCPSSLRPAPHVSL